MRIRSGVMSVMPFVAVLSACVTTPATPPPPSPQAQLYMKYAGPPIDDFTYLGRYDGFKALGGSYVVIWTTFQDAYLVKVRDPCLNLPFANAIGLTSTARTVNRRFDAVLVEHDRCRIGTIQRLDFAAMKRDKVAGP